MRRSPAAALILFISLSAASLSGQTSSTAPRTPTATPDLQGVWTNNGVTPLQRPEALKDREFLTDAEVAGAVERVVRMLTERFAGELRQGA